MPSTTAPTHRSRSGSMPRNMASRVPPWPTGSARTIPTTSTRSSSASSAALLAWLLVFHHKNACGLRQIGTFLELVQLDHFVASSYGALYSLDLHLQDDLAVFDKEQRPLLAAGMAHRDI